MTNFSRRASLFTPCVLLFTVGCAQPHAAEAESEPVAVAVAPQPVNVPLADSQPQPPAAQPAAQPVAQPQTFAFPGDLAGQGIARVVAPDTSRPLAAERFGTAPRPRTVPAKVLDPDATPRANYVLPPILLAKPVSAKPAPPQEKVPVNLGAGADTIPAKPVLPVAAVVTERARDVNLPPAAPTLGRPVNDRVSLDDPTSDFGNAEVVAGQVKVPLGVSGFMKAVIPDPFELAEHVKPKVPPTAEPSVAPVPVNPQRVK